MTSLVYCVSKSGNEGSGYVDEPLLETQNHKISCHVLNICKNKKPLRTKKEDSPRKPRHLKTTKMYIVDLFSN